MPTEIESPHRKKECLINFFNNIYNHLLIIGNNNKHKQAYHVYNNDNNNNPFEQVWMMKVLPLHRKRTLKYKGINEMRIIIW